MKKISLIISVFTLAVSPLSATSGYFCDSYAGSCNDLCGLFLGAEALYFTAFQSGLEYASTVKTHTLTYDWKLGGRGWLGYQGGGWDGVVVYDWIENQGSGQLENIEGEICFNSQLLDILFGRSLSFCNNTVIIRSFFGARGLRLDQKLTINYLGDDFLASETVRWKSELRAAGLHAGMESHFLFNPCFGVYGGFGTSLLYSKSNNTYHETRVNVNEHLYGCVPGYQLKSGIFYRFQCPSYFESFLKVGYEFSHWFNTPKRQRYTERGQQGVCTSSSSGQFTLHGVSLSLELIF